MSKKSRKRNKRILAVLGVGAAAAMAAKKKRDAVISDGDKNDGGFRKKAKSEPRGPQELGLSTAKKDTAKKDTAVTTKRTIQDNKYKGPRNTKSIRVKENTNKIYTDATGGESTAKESDFTLKFVNEIHVKGKEQGLKVYTFKNR